jgi:hypothetical protein
MQSFKSKLRPLKVRVAGAVFGLVCSLASLAAVFAVFASASGELDPLLAKVKAAPSASEVASKAPARRVRS